MKYKIRWESKDFNVTGTLMPNYVSSTQLLLHLMIYLKRNPVFLKANKEIDSCLFSFSEWCEEAKEYETSSRCCTQGDWVNGYKNYTVNIEAVCSFQCSCQNKQPPGDAFISITHPSRLAKRSKSKCQPLLYPPLRSQLWPWHKIFFPLSKCQPLLYPPLWSQLWPWHNIFSPLTMQCNGFLALHF